MGTDVPYPKSELIKREDLVTRTHDELHVVHKIQARVVERRLRLTEFFQDYDPLRKGFCNHGQVKSIFALLKISLEPDEFNELFQAYTREDGLFCYAAFCQEVDQAFTTNHLEKQPLARIAMTDASTTIHARRNFIKLTQEQQDAIAKLEEGIRARISTRRILVRPDFKQMDTAHRGLVTLGIIQISITTISVYRSIHQVRTSRKRWLRKMDPTNLTGLLSISIREAESNRN